MSDNCQPVQIAVLSGAQNTLKPTYLVFVNTTSNELQRNKHTAVDKLRIIYKSKTVNGRLSDMEWGEIAVCKIE